MAASKKISKPQTEVSKSQEVVSTPTEKVETEIFIPNPINPNQIVLVKNGFQGRLVYKSRKTGELFVWDSFGAEQEMELSELRNAKSSGKKFFINNWFMFDEQWIIDYLGMSQYYRFALSIEDFDKLFEQSVTDAEEAIAQLSDGQKKSVAYRARQLIGDGIIDSNKMIATLEACLGVNLIER
jgi:hypothetical protein